MRLGGSLLGLLSALSCDHAPSAHGGSPPARVEASAAEVILRGKGRPDWRVKVELARTPAELARGLMDRDHLDENAGMLFLFPETRVLSFWMKNTLIPLDMVFIDENFKVVGVVEDAEPRTTNRRSVGKPSRYVLEVNGGLAATHGVGPGTVVEFVNVPR